GGAPQAALRARRPARHRRSHFLRRAGLQGRQEIPLPHQGRRHPRGHCPLEEKEMLIAAAPGIYFETDHYKGWPAVLVRLREIAPDELRHRLRKTWLAQAPKRLAKQFLAENGE